MDEVDLLRSACAQELPDLVPPATERGRKRLRFAFRPGLRALLMPLRGRGARIACQTAAAGVTELGPERQPVPAVRARHGQPSTAVAAKTHIFPGLVAAARAQHRQRGLLTVKSQSSNGSPDRSIRLASLYCAIRRDPHPALLSPESTTRPALVEYQGGPACFRRSFAMGRAHAKSDGRCPQGGRETGLVVADVPVPEIGPGEVLVAVEAASICGHSVAGRPELTRPCGGAYTWPRPTTNATD